MALILVDAGGENLISVASGANHALTPDDVWQAAERIRAADMLMLQLEIAAGHGLPRGGDRRRRRRAGDPQPGPRRAAARPHLAAPDLLDAQRNRGRTAHRRGRQRRGRGSPRPPRSCSRRASARSSSPSGPRGRCWPIATARRSCPAGAIEAVDATAAGDAFNGGLAWALASGRDLPTAVRQACLVGALSATRLGAQPSLPTYEEFVRFAGPAAGL